MRALDRILVLRPGSVPVAGLRVLAVKKSGHHDT